MQMLEIGLGSHQQRGFTLTQILMVREKYPAIPAGITTVSRLAIR
jgi:hypothetical protein